MITSPISFGIIVTSRAFFSIDLARDIRIKLLEKLDKMGFKYQIMPEDATPAGAVETYADAKKYAEFFQTNRNKIDGIIICLPNFGDEQGVIETLNKADLNVPILVYACDDTFGKLDLKSRRDAFCGKLSVCNNLYQYGMKFTNTTLHTCEIENIDNDLDYFGRVCRIVKGLRDARIGAIGARPEDFQTVRFSEKLLQRSGIKIITADMSEIIKAAEKMDDNAEELKEKLTNIKEYGSIPAYVAEENIIKHAKLSVAIDNWIAANECVASAVQCWPSIEQNYGCAACLAMSMMGEKLLPSACEMDVAGAVSMYALLLASGKQPGFLDWNNSYGDDRDKCVVYHCGNFPKSFFDSEIEIENLDILGTVLGPENCFGAVKGHIAPAHMTFARISTDDTRGVIKGYIGEGEITDDVIENVPGAYGVVHIEKLQKLMNHLCKNGFEHHVAMVKDTCSRALKEAFVNYLGWEIYEH
jgi:L-fucose isomerase-like protein